jgi:hypothetical protein
MTTCQRVCVILAFASLLTGCVTVALAPGAEKVRLTSNSQDVTTCTAVGNVRVPADEHAQNPFADNNELRNQAIGLGGNTVFITNGVLGEGVAYRCP